ncbi:MAG: hypothetical protein JWQ30_2267 [Sediminibacterium sp.]|nr:hypothetical protein [Sediminibacterium sp.]
MCKTNTFAAEGLGHDLDSACGGKKLQHELHEFARMISDFMIPPAPSETIRANSCNSCPLFSGFNSARVSQMTVLNIANKPFLCTINDDLWKNSPCITADTCN